jgi:hypothetical protein
VEGALQDHSDLQQHAPSQPPRHEGSLEFDIHYALSCGISATGKHLKLTWKSMLIFILVHQAIDDFIFGLGKKEMNVDKRHKIAALTLHEEEWTQVRLFCNILQVHPMFKIHLIYIITDTPSTGDSMQTMPNRHSLRPRYRHFSMHCQRSRNFMPRGRRLLPSLVTRVLPRLLLLGWRSSTATTSEVPSQMRILWQWVGILFLSFCRRLLTFVLQCSIPPRRCRISTSTGLPTWSLM